MSHDAKERIVTYGALGLLLGLSVLGWAMAEGDMPVALAKELIIGAMAAKAVIIFLVYMELRHAHLVYKIGALFYVVAMASIYIFAGLHGA